MYWIEPWQEHIQQTVSAGQWTVIDTKEET